MKHDLFNITARVHQRIPGTARTSAASHSGCGNADISRRRPDGNAVWAGSARRYAQCNKFTGWQWCVCLIGFLQLTPPVIQRLHCKAVPPCVFTCRNRFQLGRRHLSRPEFCSHLHDYHLHIEGAKHVEIQITQQVRGLWRAYDSLTISLRLTFDACSASTLALPSAGEI